MSERQDHIIAVLTRHAGGPRAERARAIASLNEQGYADQEIELALRAETTRLLEERDRIDALRKGLDHGA